MNRPLANPFVPDEWKVSRNTCVLPTHTLLSWRTKF